MNWIESKWSWLVLLTIGLAAVYLPGLQSELLFDDQRLVDGTIFGSYGSLAEIRQRLLSYGSFIWVHALFGDGWWKQRVVNLLLHLGTAVLLYRLVRLLLDAVPWRDAEGRPDPRGLARSKDAAAGFGVLLFAFNPVSVYAVAYLVQRSIVMATLFSVAGLYLTARAAQGGRLGLLSAALVAYAAAVFSKEHAAMLPLAALALFLVVRRPPRKQAWLAAGAALLVLVAGAGVLLGRYGAVLGKAFDASSQAYVAQLAALSPGIEDKVLWLSIVNQAWLFLKYGLLWCLPYAGWMSVDLRPVFPLATTDFPQGLGLLLYPGMLAGSVFLMVRFNDGRRIAGFGLFVPAVLYATEFATVWIQDPFVLYRSYLWAIGLPFLAAAFLVGARPKAVAAAGVGLGIVFGALAAERMLSLKTEAVAWADAAAKIDLNAPANAIGRWRPLMNRGNQNLQRSLPNVALADYEAASRLGDPTGLADYHRGLVLQQLGRQGEALSAFAQAAKSRAMPNEFAGLPHFELGKGLLRQGRYEQAVAALDLAFSLLDDSESRLTALKLRAQCNAKSGRSAEAVADYRRAVELRPAERSTRIGLALALNGNRQPDAALDVLNAIQAEGDDWDVRFGRAMVLHAMGRTDKAREEAAIALRLNPADALLRGFASKLGLKP